MNGPTVIVLILVAVAFILALVPGFRRPDDPCRGCPGCDALKGAKHKHTRRSNAGGCAQ